MKAYEVDPGAGDHALRRVDRPDPSVGPGEVVIRVRAASLNFRDLLVMDNIYGIESGTLIPLSDAAGDIVEVGPGVERLRIGDRVSPSFYPDWISGAITERKKARALGGTIDGVLAEYIKLPERSVVRLAPGLSYEIAACLPCAGLTAWNSLVETADVRAGQTVVLQGTGGVSVIALHLAKLVGARVIHLSSSSERLAYLQSRGADHGINYRDDEHWDREVRALTDGQGADVVIDVGGPETLERSFKATRVGGVVVTVGFVGSGVTINPRLLIAKAIRLEGGSVGSVEMFESMNRALATRPFPDIVDQIFPFEDAALAYRKLRDRRHSGKIVIAL